MNVYITESNLNHVNYLADNMREHDLLELEYSTGETPREALTNGIVESLECFTVMVDEKPALIFGTVRPTIVSDKALIWMLSTDLIHKVGYRFIRYSKHVVKELLKNNTKLYNYVWAGNEVSVQWLKWIGFNLHNAEPYGEKRKMFHYFEMVNDNV